MSRAADRLLRVEGELKRLDERRAALAIERDRLQAAVDTEEMLAPIRRWNGLEPLGDE